MIAKVTFPIKRSESFDLETYVELAEDYLAKFYLNGQIWGEYQFGVSDDVPVGYATIPEKKAIMPRYTSSFGKSVRNKLKKQSGSFPIWSFLTDEEEAPWTNWKDAEFLFLRTNFLDDSSPLAMPSKDGAVPVPLYLLPVDDMEREYISFWTNSYRAHDQIWIGSGELEIPAYEQLADVNSSLAVDGREHCVKIEEATGIPTYYYQFRYFAYDTGEENRVCPSCGGEWRHSDIRETSFSEFQFICEPCRIVSHEGVYLDDDELTVMISSREGVTPNGDELARIGDYNPSKETD